MPHPKKLLAAMAVALMLVGLCACGAMEPVGPTASNAASASSDASSDAAASSSSTDSAAAESKSASSSKSADRPGPEMLAAAVPSFSEDYRESFQHGPKDDDCQRYIVLHDTESDADAHSVIDYWDGSGNRVAAHFIVNKDGSVMQCVPLDKIAHHAGFGDTGHNALYNVEDESRDDKEGTVPIGDWAADYGMNSFSIGIEMVHVSGEGDYPEEQLKSVDAVIAYIDAYYAGHQDSPSTIIDHKAWRTGNSDTSPEFAEYLANYQDHRTHN